MLSLLRLFFLTPDYLCVLFTIPLLAHSLAVSFAHFSVFDLFPFVVSLIICVAALVKRVYFRCSLASWLAFVISYVIELITFT